MGPVERLFSRNCRWAGRHCFESPWPLYILLLLHDLRLPTWLQARVLATRSLLLSMLRPLHANTTLSRIWVRICGQERQGRVAEPGFEYRLSDSLSGQRVSTFVEISLCNLVRWFRSPLVVLDNVKVYHIPIVCVLIWCSSRVVVPLIQRDRPTHASGRNTTWRSSA